MDITSIAFWKATGIRCLRSFLSVILGVQSSNLLITEIDWKTTFLAAFTTTLWIFIACIIAGLPEVQLEQTLYDKMNFAEPEEEDVDDGTTV